MKTPRGLGPDYGAQWRDVAMADAYVHRPPYPPETFEILVGLLAGSEPHHVLDIGAGTGDLARGLVRATIQVDALEPSDAMRDVGASLPRGGHQHLRWLAGAAESGPRGGPYDLITAAESLHWMDWDQALPRLAEALVPGAVLAVIERREAPHPWHDQLRGLIAQHSTNTEFEPYDVFAMLDDSPWFDRRGSCDTPPVGVTQTVEAHIEAMHSRNGFSRDRMDPVSATQFDADYRALLTEHGVRETLPVEIRAAITWGTLRARGADLDGPLDSARRTGRESS